MSPEARDLGGRKPGRDSLRVIAGPLLAYFDKRFQDVYDRIDDRMNGLYGRVATEVETMSEMTLVMQRFVDTAGQQVDDMLDRMQELCDSLQHQDTIAVESAYALGAVGRLAPGARILHLGWGGAGLADMLGTLGYEVTTDGASGAPLDCAVWLPAGPDQHQLDLLRKSLEPGGELVLSVRHDSAPAGSVDEWLREWSITDRRVVAVSGASATLELVRAVPRP